MRSYIRASFHTSKPATLKANKAALDSLFAGIVNDDDGDNDDDDDDDGVDDNDDDEDYEFITVNDT